MHWFAAPIALVVLVLGSAFPAVALQEIQLKRELPIGADEHCPVSAFDHSPTGGEPIAPADLQRAEALAVEGNQAAILGDHVRARAVLQEAAFLNPESGTVAYRLARSLEALGSLEDARMEYCRYLALNPEAVDRPEVEERIAVIVDEAGGGASFMARQAFARAIDAFDAGDLEGAVQAFSTAISESPEWADVHYNRGTLRIALGRTELGAADLEHYLELADDPDDEAVVQARLEEIRARIVATRSPGTALAAGLLVPGLGHFYTDRTRPGLAVVALAGAGVAAGYFYREIEVACRTNPVDGRCPSDQVSSRTESRPYLTAGLAGAAAVTVLGAIHAYVGARRARSESLSVAAPQLSSAIGGRTFALELTPHLRFGVAGLQFNVSVSR